MVPTPEDTMLQIPVTFDYKGGRSENGKNKWILFAVLGVIVLIVTIGIARNGNLEVWKKAIFITCFLYLVLVFIRFFVFKELRYSDIFETLKETKNELPVTNIWNIFDIDFEYPYIVYYRNGIKGIFVKMEKDAITGKGGSARYDHYEAVSDAYNLAYTLNMDIRHIDYMDNVGNDTRLQNLYDQLKDVSNPDMEDLLIEVYQNLEEEMSRNYSSFDIYLFLTRDKTESFIYNVRNVCSAMLGGNFITYRVLNRNDIRTVCLALFNLHDFSVSDACEEVLKNTSSNGIVPIRVISETGEELKLNKTQAEIEEERKEQERQLEEQKAQQRAKKRKRSNKNTVGEENQSNGDEDLDLFD